MNNQFEDYEPVRIEWADLKDPTWTVAQSKQMTELHAANPVDWVYIAFGDEEHDWKTGVIPAANAATAQRAIDRLNRDCRVWLVPRDLEALAELRLRLAREYAKKESPKKASPPSRPSGAGQSVS